MDPGAIHHPDEPEQGTAGPAPHSVSRPGAKRLRRLWARLRLNRQLSLVMTGVVLIPVILLAANLFTNMQAMLVTEKIETVQREMHLLQANVEKTVELCNMTTQTFLASSTLQDYLSRAKNGETVSAGELMDFYRNDITGLEKLVNANPYLYQARVYATGGHVVEMMPILYSRERMSRLSWARGDWQADSWQLDYTDTLFDRSAVAESDHIMSLTTIMETYEDGEIGVLEVAVRMDDLMPGLFQSGEAEWNCLATGDGVRYFDPAGPWSAQADRLIALAEPFSPELQSVEAKLDGERVLVSSIPLKALDSVYIRVTSLRDITGRINSRRFQFLGLLLLLAGALILAVNLLVKLMLRRFYVVLQTIAEVQEGNLAVTVPELGEDEFGILGRQLNRMLERINSLMEENVNRQLLAKNSEIRALQNQINAHFIYNVLESIKMMAVIDEKYEIADALTALGKLLRYSMRWRRGNVTVAEEIDYIHNYLTLMNLRFDYEIGLRIDLPDALLTQRIPKMTLQPLVENAVIHGIEDLAEDTCLTITGREEDGRVEIVIADQGRGMTPEQIARIERELAGEIQAGGGSGNGIGLKNVQDRIVMAFGRGYGLRFESEPGRYTRVTVRVPLTRQDEEGSPP